MWPEGENESESERCSPNEGTKSPPILPPIFEYRCRKNYRNERGPWNSNQMKSRIECHEESYQETVLIFNLSLGLS